jgi:hypothetical protein
MKNPNAEETRKQGMKFSDRLMVGINVGARSARSISSFGNNWLKTSDYLPIGPLSEAWSAHIDGSVYGTREVPVPGFTEYRKNPALHSHNPGELLGIDVAELPKNKSDLSIFIDPLDYGEGNHTAMFKWIQRTEGGNENFAPNEEVDSLITFPVIIGNAPPPPVDPCVDDPLVVTNIVWPNATTNHPIQSLTATRDQMEIVDIRGCKKVINR